MSKDVKKIPFEYKGVKFSILTMDGWHTASIATEIKGAGLFLTGLPESLTVDEAILFLHGYEQGFKAARGIVGNSLKESPIENARRAQFQTEKDPAP